MHPALLLFCVAAALCGAATVPLIWWLGLRGVIAVQRAQATIANAELAVRVDALEVLTERLVSRRASEDGLRGREKQRASKAEEAKTLAELQEAAKSAIAADLDKLPAMRKPLRSVGGAPALPEADVVPE